MSEHQGRLQPDATAIGAFVGAIFKHAEPGTFISLRAFDQFDRSKPPVQIRSVAINASLAEVVKAATEMADLAANWDCPAVFAPPIATFNNARTARTADLANGVTLSLDLDSGDVSAARRRLEHLLGPVTLATHSGGDFADANTGEVHEKTHLHWRLSEATTTPEDHTRLQEARWLAAVLVGADTTASPSAHPLRWPGSWNTKNRPRMATNETINDAAEIHLDEALQKLAEAVEAAGLGKSASSAAKASGEPQAAVERIATAMAIIPNADVTWDEWVRIGMATWRATGGSDEGRLIWTEWSAKSPKHDETECAAQWVHFAKSPPSRIGAGTLFHLANLARLRNASEQTEQPGNSSDEPAGPDSQNELILNPGAPLISARQFIARKHTHDAQRTLHHQNGAFYTWERSHYVANETEEMRARLYGFLDTAWQKAREGDLKPFQPNKNKVANVLEATAAEAQLPQGIRSPAWLDGRTDHAAEDIMACTNGLVHLPTRAILAHTPAFFTVNALNYDYDPDAPDPAEWLKFLTAIWPDDPEAIRTLQEIFGLCLTGDTRHQKAFLIVGPRRCGKGTIARVLTQMLGTANVCGPTLSGLSTQFGIQPLIGKRLAIISDARLSAKNDPQIIVERLLAITGEDSLTIDRKNMTAWTGQIGVRFVILSNELPRLSDSSGALAGRFVTMTLRRSFFGKEDLELTQKIIPEMPGILKWSLVGLDRLKARGYFVVPKSSEQAQQEMEDLGSPIGAFLRDCCIVAQGQSVAAEALYRAWCTWCHEQGRDHPGTVQTFGRDLGAAVSGIAVTNPRTEDGRKRSYNGIGLRI